VSAPDDLALVRARIVYADRELVVVDKPPGFVSAGPPRGERQSVESLLVAALGRPRVWAVHQLDRDTSGLNLFTLKRDAVARWAERLKLEGAKRYLAVTHGVPAPGRIVAAIADRARPELRPAGPLGDADGLAPAQATKRYPTVVPDDAPDGRASVTEVLRVTASPDGAAALVELRPLTGRTHQVRVHLAHVGHPLYGDKVHRGGTPRDRPAEDEHPRHALHAWRLVFGDVTFEAPLAPDLVALCARLGIAVGL